MVTICCRRKSKKPELMPAVERYRSERIGKISELAGRHKIPFAILSGKFGLIDSRTPIPYYDKLLTDEDVAKISEKSARFLKDKKIKKILFLPPDPAVDPHVLPYLETMKRTAAEAGADLKIHFVPPYPESL